MTTVSPIRRLRMEGTPASPGSYCGSAHVMADSTDLGSLAPGSVIVAQKARTDIALALRTAGAIVTSGGSLTNLATLAREFGVPYVILGRASISRIQAGDVVTVDGTVGTVTLG